MIKKTVAKLSLAYSIPVLIAAQPVALASTVPVGAGATQHSSVLSNSLSVRHTPVNLNLSSSSASVRAPNAQAVTIQIGGMSQKNGIVTGGSSLIVHPGQMVTAGQYVAVFEALHGSQTLVLNARGTATAGYLKLNSTNIQNLASLSVPRGVTLDAIGYNAAHPLNVTGALNLHGAVYALQPSPNITSVFNLGSVLISPSGLISGQNQTHALAGTFSSGGLSLNVEGHFLNQGQLRSPGTLNVTAGGDIVNRSASNKQAVIAAENINLVTGTGKITNSGLIQAQAALSLNTINSHTDLIVNNTNGILQALGTSLSPNTSVATNPNGTGTITLRTAGVDLESANAGIWGGTIVAPGGITLYGKDTELAVDKADGPVNNIGSIAHDSVKGGTLTIGQQVLSGDPTYFNNAGDISINSLTNIDGDIAIVASGNITLPSDTTISTTAADKSIFMSAGLNFTTDGGSNMSTFGQDATGDTTTTLTFDGTTNAQKSINPGGAAFTLSTSGAGTVTMVATGSISLGSGSIGTDSGNINIICGDNGAFFNSGFNANNASISSTTGNISITSAAPTNVAGMQIKNGLPTSLPTPDSAALKQGTISLGSVSTGGTLSATSVDSVESGSSGTINVGRLALQSLTQDVTLLSSSITVANTVTLSGFSSVNVNPVIDNSSGTGGVNISSSTSMSLGGVKSAGPITIGDINNLIICPTSSTADITGTGPGLPVQLHTFGASLKGVSSAGSLTIQDYGSNMSTLNLSASGGDITVQALNASPNTGSIFISGSTTQTTINGAVNISSANSGVSSGAITAAGGQVNIQANGNVAISGAINNKKAGTGNDVVINSGPGGIRMQNPGSNIVSDGAINLSSGGSSNVIQGVDNSSSPTNKPILIALTSSSASATATLGTASASIKSNGPITIGNANSAVNLTIAGDITNSGGSGDIQIILASGSIVPQFSITPTISSAGSLIVSSGNSIQLSDISASGNISVTTGISFSTASIRLGNVTDPAVGASIHFSSLNGFINTGNITANGGASIQAEAPVFGVNFGSITNTNGAGTGGAITISGASISVNSTIASDGAISLLGGSGALGTQVFGAINNSTAHIAGFAPITVDSGALINLLAITSTASISIGNTLNTNSLSLTGAISNLGGSGDITISQSSGGLEFGSTISSAGKLTVTKSGGSGTLDFFNPSVLSANGALNISNLGSGDININQVSSINGDITINAQAGALTAGGTISAIGGAVTLSAVSMTLRQITSTGGGAVKLTSTNGGVGGGTSAKITSAGPVTISASGGAINIGDINNSSGTGSVTVDSDNTITLSAVTSNSSISLGTNLSATGITLKGNLSNSTGSGDVIVTASGQIKGQGISSAGALTVEDVSSTDASDYLLGDVSAAGGAILVGTLGSGNLSLNSVTDTAAMKSVTLLTKSGTSFVNLNVIANGGSISIGNTQFGGTVNTGSISNVFDGTGAGITIGSANGNINVQGIGNISSDGPIHIVATNGSLTISGAVDNSSASTAGGSNIFFDASGNIEVLATVSSVRSRGPISIGDISHTTSIFFEGVVSNATGSGAVVLQGGSGGIGFNGMTSSASGVTLISSGQVGPLNIISHGPVSITGKNILEFSTPNSIDAGGSTVTIQPFANQTVGVNGGFQTLTISHQFLSNITNASQLTIGNTGTAGALTFFGSYTTPFPLTLQSHNDITMDAPSIASLAIGSNALTFNAGGSVQLQSINGTSTAVSITAGNSVNVNSNVTINGLAGSINASASTGGISGTGVLGAQSISLSAASIGAGSSLLTSASQLSAGATTGGGDVRISNNGAVTFTGNSASGNVLLSNQGTITLQDSAFRNGAAQNFTARVSSPDGQGNGAILIGGNVTAASITLTSNATSVGTQNGIQNINSGGLLKANQLTLSDNSASGSPNIGSSSSGGAIQTQTGNLTANINGAIVISNQNQNITAVTSNQSTAFDLSNNGNITVSHISASGQITLSATGTGSVILPSSNSINIAVSGGGDIIFSGHSVSLDGSIFANGGNVTVQPSDSSLSIGINGGAGTFQLSSANNFQSITGCNTFTVGSTSDTGAINVNPAAGGGVFDVSNLNWSIVASPSASTTTFTNNGEIDMGTQNFTVTVGGAAFTGGFTGTNSNLTLKSGSVMFSGGAAISGNAGSANFTASGALGSGAISGTGIISSASISLRSANDFIAASSNAGATTSLQTVTGSLQLSAGTVIDISNTGDLGLAINSTANTVKVTNAGAISTAAMQVDSIILTSSGANSAITTAGNLVASNAVTLNATSVTNANTINGGAIQISGQSGVALTIANTGAINATNGSLQISSAAGQSITVGVANQSQAGSLSTAGGSIILSAPDLNFGSSQIDFVGSQNLTGKTTLNTTGVNQALSVENGVTVNNSSSGIFMVNTELLNLVGSGTITSPHLVLSASGIGTISNGNANTNLDLKSIGGAGLTFTGKNLTLLSAGGIVNTGAPLTINLVGGAQVTPLQASVSSGSLNIIAGFNFTQTGFPPQSGPSANTFTLGASNAAKNISLANVTINSSANAANADAGNVLAVATGSVTLGTINANATPASGGNGGSVSIIGKGITVGSINTQGAVSGAVSLTAGTPTIQNGIIMKGELVSGTFIAGAHAGNILLNNVSAGAANVSLTTGGTSTIKQMAASTITTTGTLAVTSGTASFSLRAAASGLQLNTTGTLANATITSSVLANLLTSTVGGALSVTSTGGLAESNNSVNNGTLITAAGITLSSSNVNLGIDLGSNNSFKSSKALTINSTGTGTAQITLGTNTVLNAGLLKVNASLPTSPRPLATVNIQSPGAISITDRGTGGVTGVSGDQLVSNGAGITITASKGAVNFGDGTQLVVNGGSLAVTASGASLQMGGVGITASSLIARQLNGGGGNITLSGLGNAAANAGAILGANTSTYAGGNLAISSLATKASPAGGTIELSAGSTTQAHGAVTLTAQGTAAVVSIDASSGPMAGAVLGSGVTNTQTAGIGAVTITSSGTLSIKDGAHVTSNRGGITLKSTGAFSADNSSNVTAVGGNLSITTANSLTATTAVLSSTTGAVILQSTDKAHGISLDAGSTVSSKTTLGIAGAQLISVGATAGPLASVTFLNAGSSLSISSTSGGAAISLGNSSKLVVGTSLALSDAAATAAISVSSQSVSAGTSIVISASNLTGTASLTAGSISAGTTFSITAPAGITIGNGTANSLLSSGGTFTVIASSAAVASAGISIPSTTNGFVTVTAGSAATFSGTNGIIIGDSFTLNSPNAGVSLVQTGVNSGKGIKLGNQDLISSGSALKPGALLISASGNGGITTGADTFKSNGAGGLTIKSTNSAGLVNIGDQYNFSALGGSISISGASNSSSILADSSAIGIGVVGVSAGAPSMIATVVNRAGGAISISAPGTILLNTGTLTSGAAFSVTSSAVSTTIDGTNITAGSTGTVNGFQATSINDGASIIANNNLTISANKVGSSTLTINGTTHPVILEAGTLTNPNTPPVGRAVTNSDIHSIGALTLKAGGTVTITGESSANPNKLISVGANLAMTASNGDLTIGSNNSFTAYGGNLTGFAKTNVGGATAESNSFTALSSSTSGGGIELGAGLLTSTNLAIALAKTHVGTGINPATSGLLGANATYTTSNNLGGVVEANISGVNSSINLNITGVIPTGNVLSLVKGAQIFDATGGNTVKFDGATFSTVGLKPISMVTELEVPDQRAEAVSLQTNSSGDTEINTSNRSAALRLTKDLSDVTSVSSATGSEAERKIGSKLAAQLFVRANTKVLHRKCNNELNLEKGELFFSTSEEFKIKSDDVEIIASRGAIASVKTVQGNVYVRSCGATGTLSVSVAGTKVTLNPGEELVSTKHKSDDSEIRPADGLGRRNSQSTMVGQHCITISDFSIITMLTNSDSLAHLARSSDRSDKQLLARILKSAASVGIVSSQRGAYAAR